MKKVLKNKIVICLYFICTFLFGISLITLQKGFSSSPTQDIKVDEIVINKEIPVTKIEKVIEKPYKESDIEIISNYYDINDDVDIQQKSIIYYNDIYMQNRGIIFGRDEVFDVVAIYDGEVIKVEDNDILGKIVEIRHSNDIISIYQLLDNVSVENGDIIKQGEVIGKSSLSNIVSNNKNKLYFELIVRGELVNPLKYFGKKLGEI